MIRLNDIYPTIQGEGSQTGLPMVLIRLQGCAVGCPWCDTKETWFNDDKHKVGTIAEALGTGPRWAETDETEIAQHARELAPSISWALVTGGEPGEQDLRGLVLTLRSEGFQVACETSGTASGVLAAPIDHLTVSPKWDMPGGKNLLPDVLRQADELKAVITGPKDVERLDATLKLASPGVIVSVQPVSQQPKATALCVNLAINRGFRLSIQTHKIAGVR